MKISYEWLKTLVDVPQDPHDLEREFIRTGTEVESVERTAAEISRVVTSQVIEKVPHPNSDHMFICKMDVGAYHTDEAGNPTPLQVVCGAQNFKQGDKTVTALEGATLPGGVTISRGKLRGEDSCGMNCSGRELGLNDDHAGILILPADAPVGVDYLDYAGLADTVLDCEITPNRPDCLSMLGIAHEVSAMYDEPTHVELPQIAQENPHVAAADLVEVSIEDPNLCSRYTARVVEDITIGPSPEWMARRLVACGIRPINNVVDVTNYVMYLTGQPLHAFDLDVLNKHNGKAHIVVRAAHEGETITTLDDQERKLTSDMTLITDDGATPIALAGVMGGKNSQIMSETKRVLLESACFDAGHTSRTSRNLDLMSEASMRFERQVDECGCAQVADVAAALFESCCGARVCKGAVDIYPAPKAPLTITLRTERVRALCGAPIKNSFMQTRLERLGCKLTPAGEDADKDAGEDAAKSSVASAPSADVQDKEFSPARYTVIAPTNRPDLSREVDLIEEIVRLWGEGDITPTLPAAKNHAGGLTIEQQRLRKIGVVLRANGMCETSTYNFADPEDLKRLGMSEQNKGIPVEIMRPLVADQSHMRRDLIPGLLRSVAYNLDHGVPNVSLYEIGRVFFGHEHKSQPDEPTYVAGVMCGPRAQDEWSKKYLVQDFFDAKGVVENLLEALRITKVRFRVADPTVYGWLQPGRAAEILAEGELIGWVGNIHPDSLKNFGINAAVVAFELSVKALLRLAKRELTYQNVPTLPGVSIDLALVVDESMSYEQVVQRITSAGGKLLSEVHLFDVYRDEERVGAGKKSMAFSLTYRADDHTLTSEEVEKVHNKLVTKVVRSTGGEVRK